MTEEEQRYETEGQDAGMPPITAEDDGVEEVDGTAAWDAAETEPAGDGDETEPAGDGDDPRKELRRLKRQCQSAGLPAGDAAETEPAGDGDDPRKELRRLKRQCQSAGLPAASTRAACELYRQGELEYDADGDGCLQDVLRYFQQYSKAEVTALKGIGDKAYEALAAMGALGMDDEDYVPQRERWDAPATEPAGRKTPEVPEVPDGRKYAGGPVCPECGSGMHANGSRRSEVHPMERWRYYRCLSDAGHPTVKRRYQV